MSDLPAPVFPSIDVLRQTVAETGCCEARITLAALLAEREQFPEAIRELTVAIETASREGECEYVASAYHNLAAIYREVGDYDLARRFQQQAIRYQEDAGPAELLGLASDALALSRCDVAETLLATAADLADENDPLQASLTAAAGVSSGLRGDLRSAVRLLRIAFRQHVAQDDDHAAGCDLLNLAAVLRKSGRLRLECRCLSAAVRHFERTGALQRKSQALARRRESRQLLALQLGDERMN